MMLLEKFFSFKAQVVRIDEGSSDQPSELPSGGQPDVAGADAQGAGAQYDLIETTMTVDTSSFRASGAVRTSDGRDISFDVSLEQTRMRVEEFELHLTLGEAKKKIDPLALDLDGNGVSLSASKMEFDLDSDGTNDKVAGLAGTDAWLAIDHNGNGLIDDGRELFGPTSGNGFSELARLDSDRDGFLDEDDAAFGSVRLWRGPSGDGGLQSLSEAGIGAIALKSVETPFALEGGSVARTGVFLTEEGAAGVVQHVDLDV
jgi:hypothetical protein